MEQYNLNSQEYLGSVSLELAAKCNLKCIMCSHPKDQSRSGAMNLDQFKLIIDKLLHTKIRMLSLNMGEPFMNKELFEMISYAKDKGFFIYISTNGQLLTDESIKKILETGVDYIKFSIEGYVPDVYEKIRFGGSFERVFKNVATLKNLRDETKSSLSLKISTILMEGNEDLVGFIKYWAPYCDSIDCLGLTNHVGVVNNKDKSLVSDWIQRKACPTITPFREINVLCNGEVVICCIDFLGQCVLGNLLEQDFDEIWNSEKMADVRAKAYSENLHLLHPCKSCCNADYSSFIGSLYPEISLIKNLVDAGKTNLLEAVKSVDLKESSCRFCGRPMMISWAGTCYHCISNSSSQAAVQAQK